MRITFVFLSDLWRILYQDKRKETKRNNSKKKERSSGASFPHFQNSKFSHSRSLHCAQRMNRAKEKAEIYKSLRFFKGFTTKHANNSLCL